MTQIDAARHRPGADVGQTSNMPLVKFFTSPFAQLRSCANFGGLDGPL